MSSHKGGLLELVARGKKDAFFTANPSVSFFHSVYRKAAPFTEEVYVSQPRNNAEWGRWVEFEFEHRGDLVRKMYLRFTLPTWLPDSVASANGTSVVADPGGVTYGYCNNVGYRIIDKIQLFHDQVLLQETYGEFLDWRIRQTNSATTSLVIGGSSGYRGSSALDIGRSATPGQLRVPVPFIGWEAIGDQGFPMCAMRKQRFRLRILLRSLEDIVVASDGRAAPNPWNTTMRIQRSAGGPLETFTTLPKSAMSKGIGITLETSQVYLPRDVQEWLRIQKWRIPYKNIQIQEFTIEDNQWNAAATAAVANFQLPFRLDFVGPAIRLLAAVQGEGARLAGDRTIYLANAVRQIRLNVANIDRLQPFSAPVYRDIVGYWKNARVPQDLNDGSRPQEVYNLVFGGRDSPQPAGTLNFTRAVTPELWLTLGSIPIDPRTRLRKSFLIVYAETWRIWEIKDEIGTILIDE
jgi:hypothetical protein